MPNEKSILQNGIKTLRLLTESVSRNVIVDAINDQHVLYIYYDGDNTVNSGYRTIEPYALGVHRQSGNIVLRAWQQAGATDTPYANPKNKGIYEPPKGAWRLFRLDGITSALDTMRRFPSKGKKVRDGYRKDGDDSMMSSVITAVIAKSDGTVADLGGLTSYTDPDSIGQKLQKSDPKFKDVQQLYNKTGNQDLLFKKTIADIFGLIRQRKENPKAFNIVKKNGRIWYTKRDKNNLKSDEKFVGNLEDLYRKETKAPQGVINRSFVNQIQKDLEDKLRKKL